MTKATNAVLNIQIGSYEAPDIMFQNSYFELMS